MPRYSAEEDAKLYALWLSTCHHGSFSANLMYPETSHGDSGSIASFRYKGYVMFN